MKQLLDLVVDALATWRLSSLIADEDGPGDVFSRLRYRVAPPGARLTFWGSLLTCLWCVSVWVGLGVTLLRIALPAASGPVLRPLALSALAIVYGRASRHNGGG